jgi:hypothetical protein
MTILRKVIEGTAAVFILSLPYTSAFAQGFSEQRIPSLFRNTISADLLLGKNNSLHMVGLMDEITLTIFEDTYGRNTLYHVQRNASGFGTVIAIPDTGGFHNSMLWGENTRFLHDAALDSAGSPFLIWSKQQEYWSDVPPPRWAKPTVKSYRRNGNSWSFIVAEQSASEPRIAIGNDNAQHFVWESVSPMRRDSNYFFYRSRILYRYRSPDGILTIPQIVDTGFAPKLLVDRSDRPHLVWLKADSATSPAFQLMYARGVGGTFSLPVVLWQSLPSRRYSFYSVKPEIVVNLDSAGGVHVAWGEDRSYPNAKFFSLTYKNNAVTVDSSSFYQSYARSISFAFEPNGIVHAAWSVTSGQESDLYYSNSSSGPLFSSVRVFSSMTSASRIHLALSQHRVAHALVTDNSGLRLLRNLQTGQDTLSELVPNGWLPLPPRRAVGIDANDRIWTAYEKHQAGNPNAYEMWLLNFDRPLSIKRKDAEPLQYLLGQNYPNPFNPKTIINYQLPIGNSQLVSLKVFDLLGREVATLVDEVQSAGFKSVEFNADGLARGVSSQGAVPAGRQGYASGVYFYRLTVGGFVQTRKLVFAR